MSTFSERLRSAMDSANIKAVELHELTGISKASISEYLSGNYEPKQRNIFKMASALNVAPSYLMGVSDADTSNTHTKKDRDDLSKFLDKTEIMFDGDTYHLDEEGQQKLRNALEFVFWDAKKQNKRKKD